MTGQRSQSATRPRTNAVAGLIILVLLAVGATLLVLRRDGQAVALVPPPPGQTWADLPGGARIEILGVIPSDDPTNWWGADGSRHSAPPAPTDRVFWNDDDAFKSAHRVRLKLTGVTQSDDKLAPTLFVDPAPKQWKWGITGFRPMQNAREEDPRRETTVDALLVSEADTASLMFGLRLHEFGPPREFDVNGVPQGELDGMPETMAELHRTVGLEIESVSELDSRVQTRVRVLRLGDLQSRSRRVVVDVKAMLHNNGVGHADREWGNVFEFDEPLVSIRSFEVRLQPADRTWVTIDNISLKPGQATVPLLTVSSDKAKHAATNERPRWTQQLDNGAIVSLLALCRPTDSWSLWWTPDGEQIPPPLYHRGDGAFSETRRLPLVALVRVREERDGQPVPRPVGHYNSRHGYPDVESIDDVFSPWPHSGLYLVSIAEMTEAGDPLLVVGTGAGDWQSHDVVQINDVSDIDGQSCRVTLARHPVPDRGPREHLRFDYNYRNDRETRLQVKADGQSWETFIRGPVVTRHGPGQHEHQARMGGIQAHAWTEDSLPDIAIQTRRREWAEFSGFAIAPNGRELGPVELAKSANPEHVAARLRVLMREAAGPADGFADRFAAQVREAIRRRDLNFLQPEHLDALSRDFRDLITEYQPEELTVEQQTELLNATGWYLTHNLDPSFAGPNYGSFYGDSAGEYFTFGSAMLNLKWRVWTWLTTLDLPADERQLLDDQIAWMRKAITEESPWDTNWFMQESLRHFDGLATDPFAPTFRKPLAPDEFTLLQQKVTSQAGQGHTRILHSVKLFGRRRAKRDEPIPVPFAPEGIAEIATTHILFSDGYRMQQKADFHSERRFTRGARSLQGWAEAKSWGSAAWTLTANPEYPEAVLPADRTERLAALNESGFADIGFDTAKRQLITFRGTRIAPLEISDWSVADTLSDEALSQRIDTHGTDTIALAPFFEDLDKAWARNSSTHALADTPLLVAMNRDGDLAVLRIDSTYRSSNPDARMVSLRVRTRPITETGYLGRIGVLKPASP